MRQIGINLGELAAMTCEQADAWFFAQCQNTGDDIRRHGRLIWAWDSYLRFRRGKSSRWEEADETIGRLSAADADKVGAQLRARAYGVSRCSVADKGRVERLALGRG